MKNVSTFIAAAGFAALSATGLSALTFDSFGTAGGLDTVVTSVSGNDGAVVFDWSNAPMNGFVEFTIDTGFELYLTGYSGQTATVEYTGFSLMDATTMTSLTTGGSFCGPATLPEVPTLCNLASNSTAATLPHFEPSGSIPVLTAGPGTYYLGVFDGAAPTTGTLSFEIAAVPLPAAGLLLLGALGGLGLMRRRKG